MKALIFYFAVFAILSTIICEEFTSKYTIK